MNTDEYLRRWKTLEKHKSALVFTFGPIESRSNGYFVRVAHLTSMLRNFGFEVHLVEFQMDEPDSKNDLSLTSERFRLPNLQFGAKWKELCRRLSFDPFLLLELVLLSLAAAVRCRRKIIDSDFVLIEGGLLVIPMVISKVLARPVVFDVSNINTLVAERLTKSAHTSGLIRKLLWLPLEMLQFRISSTSIVVSDLERDTIIQRFGVPPQRVLIIPNGAEDFVQPSREEMVDFRRNHSLRDKEEYVAFVGDFSAIHNKLALRFIVSTLAPALLDRRNVRILLAGAGLEEDLTFPRNVTYLGFVPNMSCLLDIATICIAPLATGSGTKLKVLSYLRAGKPVITTAVGLEGLDFAGPSIIVARLSDFHEKVLWALDHTHELLDQSRTMAREVELTSSWEFIESRFARPAFESIVTRL